MSCYQPLGAKMAGGGDGKKWLSSLHDVFCFFCYVGFLWFLPFDMVLHGFTVLHGFLHVFMVFTVTLFSLAKRMKKTTW